ncbi:hypothetical protein DVH24_035987 [Malus domestica]|uniref:Uncharacterized protein n=1 Tax=Malus domestica TaxID=3750 RepID=A0A498JMY7_MALDO|nr:hypothetical protein DVH24_035987 [Malus domestica]
MFLLLGLMLFLGLLTGPIEERVDSSKACDGEDDGLLSFDVHGDGEGYRHLNAALKENETDDELGSNGSVLGFPPRQASYSCLQMNGKEVFHFAVRVVPQSIEYSLAKAGLPASSIDLLLLHQV